MANKSASEIIKTSGYITEVITESYTELLGREVEVEIFLPPGYETTEAKYPLLLLNDGQDNKSVKIKETVERLTANRTIEPIIVAGVKAADRVEEYGIASKKDYLGRGSRAKAYSKFITKELVPHLVHAYPLHDDGHVIAGYSMGGLSAVDIAWNHPEMFSKVGAFSGSFWWRKKSTKSKSYSDYRDRILHRLIRKGKYKEGLKFWFQTGTLDEMGDRNDNGVIDSIDDTLDLITELSKKGYRPYHDIHYYEMEEGKHNTETWALAMPEFLKWAFGAGSSSLTH